GPGLGEQGGRKAPRQVEGRRRLQGVRRTPPLHGRRARLGSGRRLRPRMGEPPRGRAAQRTDKRMSRWLTPRSWEGLEGALREARTRIPRAGLAAHEGRGQGHPPQTVRHWRSIVKLPPSNVDTFRHKPVHAVSALLPDEQSTVAACQDLDNAGFELTQ